MAADTIISRFMKQAEHRPNAPAYHVKDGGRWKATSWGEYVKQVRVAARALISMGVGGKHGNGASEGASCVCILGFNRPEWAIFDFAAMAAGAAPAGIYTTCSPPEVAYIVNHTEAKVVLVENESQWEEIKEEREKPPQAREGGADEGLRQGRRRHGAELGRLLGAGRRHRRRQASTSTSTRCRSISSPR